MTVEPASGMAGMVERRKQRVGCHNPPNPRAKRKRAGVRQTVSCTGDNVTAKLYTLKIR